MLYRFKKGTDRRKRNRSVTLISGAARAAWSASMRISSPVFDIYDDISSAPPVYVRATDFAFFRHWPARRAARSPMPQRLSREIFAGCSTEGMRKKRRRRIFRRNLYFTPFPLPPRGLSMLADFSHFRRRATRYVHAHCCATSPQYCSFRILHRIIIIAISHFGFDDR